MISTPTLAKILDVSNADILERYKKYKKQIKQKKNTKLRNGKRYYDGKAVAIIIRSLKLNKYYKLTNEETSKDLRRENKRQAKSIQQLHQLLNQQQQLALNSQNQLKQKEQQQKIKYHGWLWKFFH